MKVYLIVTIGVLVGLIVALLVLNLLNLLKNDKYFLRSTPQFHSSSVKKFLTLNFQPFAQHPIMVNSTPWLSQHYRVKGLVSTVFDAELIVYECAGSEDTIRLDIDKISRIKKPDAVAVFILTSDFIRTPDSCDSDYLRIFFVTRMHPATNCRQYQIPYYNGLKHPPGPLIKRVRNFLTDAHLRENGTVEVWGNHTRKYLAGFVGSSWTYPGRIMLSYLNKYPDISITFNDRFWHDLHNGTFLSIVTKQSNDMLHDALFTFAPRGNGGSSIRLVEAIATGSIPILIDDLTRPFEDDLSFAVRWSFPKQNLSEPLTNSTIASMEQLYSDLHRIAQNRSDYERRRKKMLLFFCQKLAMDFQNNNLTKNNPTLEGIYPELPFSSFIFSKIDETLIQYQKKELSR